MRFLIALLFGMVSAKVHHVIPHSHDDLGWLQTIQEYYNSKVDSIFTTTLAALDEKKVESGMENDLKRKFVYSEVGFVKMFLDSDPATRASKIQKIKDLQANGQWEWVNGGMSQADSASPHYEDILDNYFYGLRYLQKTFGATSQAGWQLDPFGHSLTLSWAASKFGMKHIVLTRIDQKERDRRTKEETLQFRWKFPDGASIVTHIIPGYCPYEPLDCDDDCDIAKFDLEKYRKNTEDFTKGFKHDTFVLDGCDFAWSKASDRFKFTDYVIEKDGTSAYSLWSDYRKAFESQVGELKPFFGDFFVYEEGNSDSWSGYFTTKPRLKFKNKDTGKVLRSLRALAFTSFSREQLDAATLGNLADMAEDFGILLHHDSITGTAKIHVDEDYVTRFASLLKRTDELTNRIHSTAFELCDFNDLRAAAATCNIDLTKDDIYLRLFNPTPHDVSKLFEVHLPAGDITVKSLVFLDSKETQVDFDFFCGERGYCSLYFRHSLKPHALHFYKVVITKTTEDSLFAPSSKVRTHEINTDIDFDGYKVSVLDSELIVSNTRGFPFVNSISYSQIDSQKGGHYITKYDTTKEFATLQNIKKILSRKGKLLDLVDIISDDIDIRFMRHTGDLVYFVETTVHKTEKLNSGVEIQINVKAELPHIDEFKTDSNGLFEINRVKTEKMENNIFPISRFIDAFDRTKNQGLRIFTDRAQGAWADSNGFKIWIQRTAKVEDQKGNEEILKADGSVLMRHIMWNYKDLIVDDETNSAIFDIIENSYLLAVSNQAPKSKSFIPETNTKLPYTRLSFDVLDEKSFLVRAHSSLYVRLNNLNFKQYFAEVFKNATVNEVDFEFVTLPEDKRVKRPVASEYILQPLQFVTFLVTI